MGHTAFGDELQQLPLGFFQSYNVSELHLAYITECLSAPHTTVYGNVGFSVDANLRKIIDLFLKHRQKGT